MGGRHSYHCHNKAGSNVNVLVYMSESVGVQLSFPKRLKTVVISALVMHSSETSYNAHFPFFILSHILYKPMFHIVVRTCLAKYAFYIYFAVCNGAGKRKYLVALKFKLCVDAAIFIFGYYCLNEELNYLVSLC